jgi:hypothetical protein
VNAVVVYISGGAALVAAVVYILWPERKRKPTPPRRIPGLPVDGKRLTGREAEQYLMAAFSYHHKTADDPMEGRTV